MYREQIAAIVVPAQPSPNFGKVGSTDPLAPIAGKSIHAWIADAALAASVRRIGIIANRPTDAARSELAARADHALIEFITPMNDVTETLMLAAERLGSELTLSDSAHILILPAEAPHVQPDELRALVDAHISSGAAATISSSQTAVVDEPLVVRDASGDIVSISETTVEAGGLLCIRASMLIPALNRTVAPRWHGGAPLAEIAGVLTEVGHVVEVIERDRPLALIRSAASRAPIEMSLRDRIIDYWIERDVVMPDPRQVSIDATVTIAKGVQVLPGTVLEGSTVIGDGAVVGPNSHVIDSTIGSRSHVPHAVVRGAEVSALEHVAPFSVRSDGSYTAGR